MTYYPSEKLTILFTATLSSPMRVYLEKDTGRLLCEYRTGLVFSLDSRLRSPAWIRWWATVVECPLSDRQPLWEERPSISPLTIGPNGVNMLPVRPSADGRSTLPTEVLLISGSLSLDGDDERLLLQVLREIAYSNNYLYSRQLDLNTLGEDSVLEGCHVSGKLVDGNLTLNRCTGESVSARICISTDSKISRMEADDYLQHSIRLFFEPPAPLTSPRYLTAPVVGITWRFAEEFIHCSHLYLFRDVRAPEETLPTLTRDPTLITEGDKHQIWTGGALIPLEEMEEPPQLEGVYLRDKAEWWTPSLAAQIRPRVIVSQDYTGALETMGYYLSAEELPPFDRRPIGKYSPIQIWRRCVRKSARSVVG